MLGTDLWLIIALMQEKSSTIDNTKAAVKHIEELITSEDNTFAEKEDYKATLKLLKNNINYALL